MKLPGFLFIVLAAAFWAVMGGSSKILFQQGVSPMQVVQIRLTLSSLLLLIFLLLFRREDLKVSKKDLPFFAALGCFGYAANQFAYFFAISKIQVAAAIFLEFLAPALIAFLSYLFFKKRLGWLGAFSIFGSIVGCFFVVEAYQLDILKMNRMGILGGLLAAVTFAIHALLSERGLRTHRPWTVLFYGFSFGAITWNILHPPLDSFQVDYGPEGWGIVFFICIFGTLIPFWLLMKGIQWIGATYSAITATLEPVFAAIFAYFVLDEALTWVQILGATLVVGSVTALQLRKT